MEGSALSRFDPAYGKRGELGELARNSGRLLNERSLAHIEGAENLLLKAAASIEAGDTERAERLIERAAAMPYDAREEGSPGIRGASLLVHGLVLDEFEASTQDETEWLDVPVAVYPHLDGPGKAELASVVHGLVVQDVLFDVSRTEERRIREVFGGAPLEADLGDHPTLTTEGRRDIIRSLVVAAVALQQGYAAAGR